MAILGVALIAFAVEGALGFGATVIAASIGALFAPLSVVLPAFAPANVALSAWLAASGRREIAWRVLVRELGPPMKVGMVVGVLVLHALGVAGLACAFAAFVTALAAVSLARPRLQALSPGARIGLLALGGVAHGLFGTGGPLVVYVARRRLPAPAAFRATLAVVWLGLGVTLIATYATAGLYTPSTLRLAGEVALAVPPGLVAGELLHRRFARHDRVVWLVLLAAGLTLLARG